MKILLIISVALLSVTSFAKSTLYKTEVSVQSGPSLNSIDKALLNLKEAKKAFIAKEIKTYKLLVSKAKEDLESVDKKLVYKSAFITSYSSKMVNYFDSNLMNNTDIRYEVMINETCFNGHILSAKALLAKMIESDALNYDEVWFDNPVVKNNTIFIDMVDGPNEYIETLKINSCK